MELIGRQLENYRIDALLGQGGMGAVYRAYDVNLARPVALKIMHGQFASQPEFQQRFLQEAQAAARLGGHPSIVNIYNFAARQGLFYMVMEFVPGASLGGYIKHLQQQNQVVRLSETLLILAQVADALGYAHRNGVIHRDVKPDNVLLKPIEEPDREEALPVRAVVTDFGLAKLREGGVQTQTGTFMGTLPYMSPEQCLNKELDGRSDIYSLGIMLFQLATGKLPFDIRSPTDAVLKHINEQPPEPQTIRPGVPEAVANIINRAIAKEPADRFQTGEDLAAVLRRAAANLTDADVTHFAPPESVLSLSTQLLPAGEAAEPSRLGVDLTAMPGQARLLIAQAGHEPQSVSLEKNSYILGRSSSADVVLNGEGVSRRHARMERTAGGHWQITDLGSTNGTFLAESRLLPDITEVWDESRAVQIGPFHLRWQSAAGGRVGGYAAGVAAMPGVGASFPPTAMARAPVGGTQVSSGSGRLSMVVQPTNVDVVPGSRADMQVELFNQGPTVDHLNVALEGLPQGWVSIPQNSLQLMPGANGSLPLTIHPPMNSGSTAGQHPYRLVVRSSAGAGESASVSGRVMVKPFEQFSIDMRPKEVPHGGICRVLINNEGNTESEFRVTGRDPGETVVFEQQGGRLRLAPGQREVVDLSLSAKNRPFLGSRKLLPFEIMVGTREGQRQSISGQLDVKPVIPVWLLPLLGILLLVLCLTGAGLLGFFTSRNTQATQTAQAIAAGENAATQTAEAQLTIAFQETAAAADADAATATVLAITAEAAGDNDGDGLSNAQELAAGTNPDVPDTDGDGLNDGQEVNQFGTNPRQQDTDGDTLSDGAEVNEHGTSPTNPDTDGDGIPDGVEVNSGTDPLQPPTATPPPTGTSPPTDTPPPTSTTPPTDTPTHTPTATPTETLTPTPALPQTILTCPGVGTGGDRADLRGIRFTVNQSFTQVKVRMAGGTAGAYNIDAELRRSNGYLGPAEAVLSNEIINVPASGSEPQGEVILDFGNIPVAGNETFTLKFIVNSGPGTLFFEIFGIGNTPCANVEETNENDVANPTERSDPAGFEVIFVP
jgi:serine/threonine protein kinase